jgi:hypothetical protein
VPDQLRHRDGQAPGGAAGNGGIGLRDAGSVQIYQQVKYIFIVGLEHSGTTLLSNLVAQQPNAIALGEVAAYFSPAHMEHYIRKWGHNSDARLCSCRADWDECEFWGPLSHLNGLNSTEMLDRKYAVLLDHVRSLYPEKILLVDSSKRTDVLEMLNKSEGRLPLSKDELFVVFMIKDVRSFSTSIRNKAGQPRTLIHAVKTFRWWWNYNRNMLDFLNAQRINYVPVLYEKLCDDPAAILATIFARMKIKFDSVALMMHENSHIAMGNKNFALRNSKRLHYDNRWYLEDDIQALYLAYWPVRRLNRALYDLCSGKQ